MLLCIYRFSVYLFYQLLSVTISNHNCSIFFLLAFVSFCFMNVEVLILVSSALGQFCIWKLIVMIMKECSEVMDRFYILIGVGYVHYKGKNIYLHSQMNSPTVRASCV